MRSIQLKNPFRKKAAQEPDNTVSNYVESFFGSIRYSKDAEDAKKSVVSTLEPVYASMKQENGDDAFKNFVARYPDLETLLDAAGIDRV